MDKSLVFIIFLIAFIEFIADYHLNKCNNVWSSYFIIIMFAYLVNAILTILCKQHSKIQEMTIIQSGFAVIITIFSSIILYDGQIKIHELIALLFILIAFYILWKYRN